MALRIAHAIAARARRMAKGHRLATIKTYNTKHILHKIYFAQLEFEVRDNMSIIIVICILIIISIFVVRIILKCYVKCPADRILVIYGKVDGNKSTKCIHGGTVFILPFFQDYSFLTLTPFTVNIELKNALTANTIRVQITANFTCAISTTPEIMQNAAERLFNQPQSYINDLAQDIIKGQIRLITSTMHIEELISQRDKYIHLLQGFAESELNKIGLTLITIDIIDIHDEAGYLDALTEEFSREIAPNDSNDSVKPNPNNSMIQSEVTAPTSNHTDNSTEKIDGLSTEILDNSTLLIKDKLRTVAKISLSTNAKSGTNTATGSDINARSVDLFSSNSLLIQRNSKDIMRIDFESEQIS